MAAPDEPQPGESVTAIGAADEDRQLVSDESVATADESLWFE